jgi:hypothetical protein
VARRKARRLATARSVDEPRDAVSLGRRNGSHAIPSCPNEQRSLAVSDGRESIGTVEVCDGTFVALDINGNGIGRYGTLKLAVRSLRGGVP